MPSGLELLKLARTRIGEEYVNVLVPKNNPNWHGPWDCAEFMSWLVYQVGGYLYGCLNNNGNPAVAEAYTGAWESDSAKLGKRVDWKLAAGTIGGVLLRFPPEQGAMGHIAVSDGKGGTVEAKGKAYGVVADKAAGRYWDTGILLPKFDYDLPDDGLEVDLPAILYKIGAPNMRRSVIKSIQRALASAGVDPGPIDGKFGGNTAAAVAAFQAMKGLVVDGQVGTVTAVKLGVDLEAE
ncbi:peptidoglycan-binding protein [Belnapia sp. T6]|uniref:Peptidoglycan-binding protein n=1 Tax=Belnapia mucosa TaxID=2804532 RepID=A0ABS1VAE2_9PROT|nr:peptidoglycan-binding domain-containing protein [Belnapia mucosa]MBL6458641.1 peptidoglycan-binding protein [Belnapia mucosa]